MARKRSKHNIHTYKIRPKKLNYLLVRENGDKRSRKKIQKKRARQQGLLTSKHSEKIEAAFPDNLETTNI